MAFRFRKSVKIAPGVRLNLNKKSTSVSFGGKGFHHTISSAGRRTTTTGLPGTGISYSTTESVHKDHGAEPSTQQSNPKVPTNGQNKGCSGCLWVLLALIFWPFALSYWLWTSNKFHASKKARVGIIAAFWAVLLVFASIGGDSNASDATQASPMPTATVAAETPQPTAIPTEAPASEPTASPTEVPASEPTAVPTEVPTPEPTAAPTETPTPQPTEVPATESISSTTSTNSSVYQAGMVYIASSGNGKKYHRIPSCSGMDNATAVTLEQAEAWGYTPCKRCY